MQPFVMPAFGATARRASEAMTPEERDGLLRGLFGTAGTALGAIGETLDTPGAYLRGLLAGQAGERVSGRDMLQNWGLVGENQEGFHPIDNPADALADIGGFVAEVVLDPLSLITGPGKALTAAGKAAQKSGKMLGLTPTGIVKEIASGERAAMGFRTPTLFGLLPERTFAPEALSGATAAKVAGAVIDNPLTRGMRSVFSANPYIKVGGKASQQAADVGHEAAIRAQYEALEGVAEARKMLPQLEDAYKNLAHVNGDVASASGLDEMLRQAQEFKVPADLVSEWSKGNPLAMQAASDMANLARTYTGKVMAQQDKLYDAIRQRGGDVGDLTDKYVEYATRRASHKLGQQGLDVKSQFEYSLARKDAYRDVAGGTVKINEMTRDPFLVGWKHKDLGLARKRKQISDSEAAMFSAAPRAQFTDEAANYIVANYGQSLEKAKALADAIGDLPLATYKDGLFGHTLLGDSMAYIERGARHLGAIEAVSELAKNVASKDEIGDTLLEAFGKMKGINPQSALQYVASKMGVPAVDAAQLRLPEMFGRSASNYMEMLANSGKEAAWLRGYDKVAAVLKANLTLPFPAFHSRNAVSGFWQNAVTAFKNPLQAVRSYKAAFDVARGKNSDLAQEMLSLGVVPREISTRLGEIGGFGDELGKLPDVSLAGVKSSVSEPFKGLTGRYRRSTGHSPITKAWDAGSPFNPLSLPDAPNVDSGKGFFLHEIGRDAHNTIEYFNRAAHYIAMRENGYTPGMAAWSTKLAHFDAKDIAQGAPFQAQVARRLIPFYSWTRANMTRQFADIINSPGGPQAQTVRALSMAMNPAKGDVLPQHIQEGVAVRVGGDDRNAQYLHSSSLLPVEQAFNQLAFVGGRPDLKRTGEKLLGQMHPFIQTPISAITGRQFWSGRDLEDLRQVPFEASPVTNMLIGASPAARYSSTASMLSDERKNALMKAVNFLLGGIRTTTVDRPKAMAMEGKELLQKILGPRSDVHVTERLYVKPEDIANLPPEVQEQLSLYNALIRLTKELRESQPPVPK